MELDRSAEPDNLLAAEESSLRQLGKLHALDPISGIGIDVRQRSALKWAVIVASKIASIAGLRRRRTLDWQT